MADGRVRPLSALAERIAALPAAGSRIVAVDGSGGGGKSTFARALARAAGGAPVVEADDLGDWTAMPDWWGRLEAEVLSPPARGDGVRFRRFDWGAGTFAEWVARPPSPVVIVEGVSTARAAATPYLSLAIWVSAPPQVRIARMSARGGHTRERIAAWMDHEDRHFAADRTVERCAVLVDGAPAVPIDPDVTFVRLERPDPPGRS